MIYEFKGFIPVIHESSFIHPQAAVTGNVIIGKNVYVGPGAAIRGDWGEIIIEDGCNVQENCTIHMFPGKSMVLKSGAHIGHGAIIHGANIGKILTLLEEACGYVNKSLAEVIIEGPKVVGVVDWKSQELVIRMVAKTVPLEQMKVETALRHHIKLLFDEAEISPPNVQIIK